MTCGAAAGAGDEVQKKVTQIVKKMVAERKAENAEPPPARKGLLSRLVIEKPGEARWTRDGVFAASQALRADAPAWTFYEGPPTANGKPGIHHVFARTVKDLFCRHRAMLGHHVPRKAGWDTHGLPVEIEVEKELGIEGKQGIEDPHDRGIDPAAVVAGDEAQGDAVSGQVGDAPHRQAVAPQVVQAEGGGEEEAAEPVAQDARRQNDPTPAAEP